MIATISDRPIVSGTNSQWYMAVSANCARDQSTTLIRSFMILYLDIMLTSKVFPHGTGPVCVIVIVTLEQVGEEKQFEYQKKK